MKESAEEDEEREDDVEASGLFVLGTAATATSGVSLSLETSAMASNRGVRAKPPLFGAMTEMGLILACRGDELVVLRLGDQPEAGTAKADAPEMGDEQLKALTPTAKPLVSLREGDEGGVFIIRGAI